MSMPEHPPWSTESGMTPRRRNELIDEFVRTQDIWTELLVVLYDMRMQLNIADNRLAWVLPGNMLAGVDTVEGLPIVRAMVERPMLGVRPL